MTMRLAPEFRLFCLALRYPQQAADAEALRRAIAAAPDWTCIVAGAQRHRLAARALAGLQGCGATEVPDNVIDALRRQAVVAARRDLSQTAEIGRLMRIFDDAGIRVLVLKGIVLSSDFDDRAFARGARDIDLLVDPEQFAQADTALAAAGYRSQHPAQSPRQTAAYHWALKEVSYVHAGTRNVIELHDRLADNPNLLSIDFATLWRERATVHLGEAAVPTLARPHLALYLSVHGAGHTWERLRWLVDLAQAWREPGAIAQTLVSADAVGLGGAVRHALLMAHDWLGLPVAEHAIAQARSSPRVRHLDRLLAHFYAGSAWCQAPSRASWRGFRRYSVWHRLYVLSLKRDFRYLASQARRELFTAADWGAVRLPDALFFLYPLIRPVGFLLRRWRH
jgi:Uncharacterised nucleotidyltransferase